MMAATVLLTLVLPALERADPLPFLAGAIDGWLLVRSWATPPTARRDFLAGAIAGWLLVARMAHVVGGSALVAVAMGVHNFPE